MVKTEIQYLMKAGGLRGRFHHPQMIGHVVRVAEGRLFGGYGDRNAADCDVKPMPKCIIGRRWDRTRYDSGWTIARYYRLGEAIDEADPFLGRRCRVQMDVPLIPIFGSRVLAP